MGVKNYLDIDFLPIYNDDMPKRSSKYRDINQIAKSILEMATGSNIAAEAVAGGKNPAAVILGRLGGLKGGKARASKLTAKQRSKIAEKAAKARWQTHG
jgi:hypothetical protein